MTETQTRIFAVTVFTTARRDLAWYGTAATAPELEDLVTKLHVEYPAPHYRIDVETR